MEVVKLAPVASLTAAVGNRESVLPCSQRARDVAVKAIVRETGCSSKHAVATLAWIESFVKRSRLSSYRTQFPTDGQLGSPQYATFDKVVPHGAFSKSGSAHEAIERALLDPAQDEFSLVHDMRDEYGSPRFCQVQVCLGVMRN